MPCWTVCFGCDHRYCEFCFQGSQYHKKQYPKDDCAAEPNSSDE